MNGKIRNLKIAALLLLAVNSIGLAQGENLKVGEITFKRLYQLPEEYLMSKIPVKTGDEYTNKDLSDIYLSLKKLDYISNVNVYPNQQGDKVNLTIEVDERANALSIAREIEEAEQLKLKTNYVINDIKVEGINLVDPNIVYSTIDVKLGEYLVPQKAIDVTKKIFDTGYFARVEPVISRNDNNTVSIVYKVVENPIVKSISIKGNTIFSNAQLVEASGIKIGQVLNKKLLDPETNGIIKEYDKEGYSLARVEEISVDPEQGDVEIVISEGIVNKVTFRKYTSKVDNERANEKTSKLRTKPYVFERVLKVKSGELFKKENAESTIIELYRTGIFSSIAPVYYNSTGTLNENDVEFLVEERPTATINGSISYGTEVGLVGGIKLADSNFMGKAQEASFNVEISNEGDKTLEVSLFDPWIKGTERIQGGGSIYWREDREDNVKEDEISRVKRVGTRWTLGKGLNSDISARATIRYDRYNEYLKNKTVSSSYNLLAITPSLVYDTRDNAYNPTKGIYAVGTYERGNLYSRKSLVGEKGKYYNQVELDLRAYHPTFFKDKNVMAYRAVWGRTGSGTPEALRFSIGGSESIRGYEVGLFDGFDKFHATIENRTQINKSLQFVTFFDIGNAWQTQTESETGYKIFKPNRKDAGSFKDLKKGYGIGLRLETPMGPLRFDYGWPMDPEAEGKQKTGGKFYFSFGQTF